MLGGGSGRIEGELAHAITHQKNEFKVIALDEAGRPKGAGGDECVVHVHRCGEVVRVKTSDNGDGSYAVSFNPDTSGEYSIDISVGGVPLTGSPFSCQASTRTPHPPNCLVSGEALRRAVSREQQHVEVRFKDVLGNTAHAADVDVYAEPVDSLDLAEAEEELNLPGWLRTGQPASPRSARGGAAYGSALHSPRPAHEGVHTAKVKVPLVVRVGVGTDSERVGQVRAGRTVYVLEERTEIVGDSADGPVVRALIALDADESSDPFEEDRWRLAYAATLGDRKSVV